LPRSIRRCIVIRGRSKLLIEVSGYKIDPIEVEETLMTLPAVAKPQ